MAQQSVCPVALSGVFASGLRRLIHNPEKILAPWVGEGNTVLEVGCGPGFFTLELARLVGPSGRVVAVDVQQGMLDKVAQRLAGTDMARRVTLRRCAPDRLDVEGPFDFVLLFYMAHEVADIARFFRELRGVVSSEASVLLVEPPIHVSKADFAKECAAAEAADFAVYERLGWWPEKAVLLAPVSTG
jgi:ubiquinone/menaquinone biosynthesis C-methylase UbiE